MASYFHLLCFALFRERQWDVDMWLFLFVIIDDCDDNNNLEEDKDEGGGVLI